MTPALHRREFLRYAALAGFAVGGTGLLAACGGSGSSGSSGGSAADGSKLGSVAVQLSWIKNIEFAGEYFALEKGYYKEAGFDSVDLVAGGAAGTGVEAGLDTGKIWIGMSAPQLTAPAVLNGLPAKIVGATYQKNPFCIVSSATRPINTPQEMAGKKIGVQDSNQLVFGALLDANGIDPKSITVVPAQFDPSPLANGEVDGWVSYVTNEPITLASKGFKNHAMLFADFNLPLVAETFTVKQDTIDNERDKLKAFLIAEIKGWRDAIANPAESARLAAEVYGKDQNLDVAEQTEEAKAQVGLVVSADTKANGLFTMTKDLIDENIAALKAAKLDIAAADLFDLSIIDEIYTERSDLKV
ncbi:MAG TPA: ABC transporter substrate-binding protein [Mycobacterium sp.]|jgi:ABC-type nitrate/sulfonate/bicarbonate transport system substrate-binding protein|nr:ABC transporter substrate-binding protein [Mycobacterium sp.]